MVKKWCPITWWILLSVCKFILFQIILLHRNTTMSKIKLIMNGRDVTTLCDLLVVLLFVWRSLCLRASLVERIPSARYIYYPRIIHIHGHISSKWLHVPHTPDVPLYFILWCGISFHAKNTSPAQPT